MSKIVIESIMIISKIIIVIFWETMMKPLLAAASAFAD